MRAKLVFHQLFDSDSSTFSYVLGDPESGEAVIIDPVLEKVDRDLKLLEELGLRLKYVLDTHVHADHVTGAGELRARTGAKTVVSKASQVPCADLLLEDGDELAFGPFVIHALATPGHTSGCMSFYCEERVFTGDALLIRGTGRTDFQQGSAERLFESIRSQLFTLPPETQVYPGHDYRGMTSSTIDAEKRCNPRVGEGKSKSDFMQIMSELKLAEPKRLHEALPANMACGKVMAPVQGG